MGLLIKFEMEEKSAVNLHTHTHNKSLSEKAEKGQSNLGCLKAD